MTEAADRRRMVAAECLGPADALEATGVDWDTASPCQGWRVREVVAHMTVPARCDRVAFMPELEARDFDVGRLSDEIAARDAALPTERLRPTCGPSGRTGGRHRAAAPATPSTTS